MAHDPSFTALELFAGGGGMAIGTQLAGFSHVGLLERDVSAVETLRLNTRLGLHAPDEITIAPTDVTDFDFGAIESNVDVLAGGAPCQPFSLGGRHRGKDDERNLFPSVFAAQRILEPRAVILENVRGLMRQSFRPYLQYIVLSLALPGVPRQESEDWREHKRRLADKLAVGDSGDRDLYSVHVRCLNCADYGVPQKRHRVFFLALKAGATGRFAWPNPTHSKAVLTFEQTVSGEYWRRHDMESPQGLVSGQTLGLELGDVAAWRTVRDALARVPAPVDDPSLARHPNHIFVDGAKIYPGHTGSPIDEPSKTIKAGVHGVPGGENMVRYRDGSVRYYSVHEAALIQGFPDWYVFAGSRTEAMRQIGNAAPSAVCEKIARAVREALISEPVSDNAVTHDLLEDLALAG